jgi:hypothetical protein
LLPRMNVNRQGKAGPEQHHNSGSQRWNLAPSGVRHRRGRPEQEKRAASARYGREGRVG